MTLFGHQGLPYGRNSCHAATYSSGMIGSVSSLKELILRCDMRMVGSGLGATLACCMAINPAVAMIIVALVVALITAAVIWRRIAPLRERVRLANEEADRIQRNVTQQAPNDT
jgi:hypothetical protein